MLRTGMGPARARIAAARGSALDDAAAVAVAGLCAGVAPEAPGRATSSARPSCAEDGREPVDVPGSALLAAGLRRRGLRVHVGPISPSSGCAGPPERRVARRDDGVLAVDMESAWLAEAAGGRPLAVLRVVADAAGRGSSTRGRALDGARALAVAAPRGAGARGVGARGRAAHGAARRRRARSAPASSGRSRSSSSRSSSAARPIYVRKQIVHNEHVVAELERRGAVFVEELDEVPDGATVVFSAHGVSPAVQRDARRRAGST